jgi:hypothetical protein
VPVVLAEDPGPGDTAYVFSDGEVVWFVTTSVEDVEGVIASLG